MRQRLKTSHDHFFASLGELWQRLPGTLKAKFPSPDSLRHQALIACGYSTETTFRLDSAAIAQHFAAALLELDTRRDTVVEQYGCIVRRYTAMSQSYAAMGRADFQTSKWKVLNWVYRLLGEEQSWQAERLQILPDSALAD